MKKGAVCMARQRHYGNEWVTKADLSEFATKSDLSAFATKADLSELATRVTELEKSINKEFIEFRIELKESETRLAKEFERSEARLANERLEMRSLQRQVTGTLIGVGISVLASIALSVVLVVLNLN